MFKRGEDVNIFVRVCMFWHSSRGCFWQANYSQIQIVVSWSRRAFTICRGQDTVFSAPYLEGLCLTKVFQFPLSKIFYILEYLSVSFPWNLLWMGININLSNKKYWRKPFIIEIYKHSLPPSGPRSPQLKTPFRLYWTSAPIKAELNLIKLVSADLMWSVR